MKFKINIDTSGLEIDVDATKQRVYNAALKSAEAGSRKLRDSVPVGPSPPVGKYHTHMRETIGYHVEVDMVRDVIKPVVSIKGPHVVYQNYKHKTHKHYLQKTEAFVSKDLEKRLAKSSIIVFKKGGR